VSPGTLRVVAGRFGGRRLATPAGAGTRPTADRVREALFSILGPLDGLRVLDLFAGSGALAIEALSRGAAHALLVERDPRAAAVARANLESLGLGPEAARVLRAPAATALRSARERGDAYDLVFLDPPYRDAPALGAELGEALPPLLAPGARVVAESDRRAPLELPLPLLHDRRYGDTLIRIHSA
jgi:16S rRNA (guanine966-N2)-methyltransferase